MISPMRAMLVCCLLLLAQAGTCLAQAPAQTPAQAPPAAQNGPQILEQFSQRQPQRQSGVSVIDQHERQVIMFSIGAALLALLIGTASVGIAVAVFGKQLFLVHMILAGLTVTLALVHVVVGMVWFYPF